MLDPPIDGNEAGGGTPEERGHLNIVEGATHKTLEPAGKGCFLEDLEDPRVVNGIKGFGSVEKKSESLVVISDALIEETVEIFSERVTAC